MKKLLLFLTFLPLSLLAQEPPIQQLNNSFNCSVQTELHTHKKEYKISTTYSSTQEIDAVEYLLSNSLDDVFDFVWDFNRINQTDIFSEQNTLNAVNYFKENVIQQIDGELSNKNPEKFINYFRAFDYHAWYNSNIDLTDNYISALIDMLNILYRAENYWIRSEELNSFRWFATLLMDIPERRADVFDLILLNFEKYDIEYMDYWRANQVAHLSALSSIIWRGFINTDLDFIQISMQDSRMVDYIFEIIEDDWFIEANESWVSTNFINIFYPLILRLDDLSRDDDILSTYDIEAFKQRIINLEQSLEFGGIRHAKLITTLADVVRDTGWVFDIDFEEYKEIYFRQNFENSYTFDDETITIHSNLDEAKINSLYLALRETRANFFKLAGTTDPLESDPNDHIDMYIFESEEAYGTFGGLLFDIPTNNGGIYIEQFPGLFTYDRSDNILTLEILLKHEYVHYLDGRYNIEGDFAELEFYDFSRSVFWVEGLANFVASASVTDGFYISEGMGNEVANSSSRFTLNESINTDYSYGFEMYAYAETAWGFLYNYRRSQLDKLFDLLQETKTQEFFDLLDSISNDASLEPLYQQYMEQIKEDVYNGLINDPELTSYDFTQPEIENDSISYALNQSGLSDFEILESFQNPYKFVKIQKDTVVTDLNEFDKYLESVITNLDKDLYNGFKIATAQIDSVDEDLNIIYSLEIPVNGKITVETEDNGEDNEGDGDNGGEGDNEGDGDPVDPVDPIDPVDPEPIITKIVAYPNPTADIINITGLTPNSQVFIYNLNGQIVFNTVTSENVFSYSMSRFQTGMYIVVVKTQKETKSLKIIKR